MLNIEPEEGMYKIEDALKTIQLYTKSYYDKKDGIAKMFKDGDTVVEWSFNTDVIFARLSIYLKRLHLLDVT